MNSLASHPANATLAIISAMITPAILILATGNLITSTLTRLARVTDRARFLIRRARDMRAAGEVVHAATYDELLKRYVRRSSLVERALSAFYLAIGAFVTASLAIAFDNVVRHIFPWLATVLVVLGAILLLAGALSIFLETNLAAGILRQEIELSQVEADL